VRDQSSPPPDPAHRPRIASLVPAATEIVAALGAEDLLVGISHECDYPASITSLPRLTASPVDSALASGAIDAQVRALHAAGRPVIAVDAEQLEAARPDLILTQDLCDVCAVIDGDVRSLAELMTPPPRLLSLTARTLPGIFADIDAVGAAIGRARDARALNDSLQARLRALSQGPARARTRVVVVEWLEPLYLAGHWVPEMVSASGGSDVGASPGEHSRARSWQDIEALDPELIVVALCGFGLPRAVAEWEAFRAGGTDEAAAARRLERPVVAIDGNAFTSRPGPRVVDGAELLHQALAGRQAAGLARLR